jgi:deazaflavin-dependent oxidoreductase (nitroreductase family)
VVEMGVAQMMMRAGTGFHAKLVKLTGAMGGGSSDGSLLVLTHRGAKSGKFRETPVVFVNHEGGYVVAASMGGAPTNPGWYHNLKAHPDTTINVARKDVAVTARELEGEEYRAVWERFAALDKRWEQYRERTERTIPLMHLQPR